MPELNEPELSQEELDELEAQTAPTPTPAPVEEVIRFLIGDTKKAFYEAISKAENVEDFCLAVTEVLLRERHITFFGDPDEKKERYGHFALGLPGADASESFRATHELEKKQATPLQTKWGNPMAMTFKVSLFGMTPLSGWAAKAAERLSALEERVEKANARSSKLNEQLAARRIATSRKG